MAQGQIQFRSVHQVVRTLRIITIALIGGIAVFSGASLFVQPEQMNEGLRWPLIGTAAGLTVISVVASFVVVQSVLRSLLEKMAGASLHDRLQRVLSARIIALAVIEGPGLLWVITSMLFGEPVWLGGAAFSILLLAAQFPNEQQFEEWLGGTVEELDAQLTNHNE